MSRNSDSFPVFFFILLLIILLAGCSTTVPHTVTANRVRGVSVDEFVIEGCTYLEVSAGSFTHKGNCPSPIHSRRDTVFVEVVK